jgi:hypothetical protein
MKRKILALLSALAILSAGAVPAGAAERAYITVDVFYVVDCSSVLKFDFPENLDDPALIKLGEEVLRIDEAYRAERAAELGKALGGALTADGVPFKFTDSRGKSLSLAVSVDPAQTKIQDTVVSLASPYTDTPENSNIMFTLTSAPIPAGYILVEYRDRPSRTTKGRTAQVTLIPENGFPAVDYSAVAVPGAAPVKSETSGTAPAALTAKPTASSVLFNGQTVAFDAYNISGSNYFKLRDLAYALNGSEKQFNVGWDGTADAVNLTSGKPYAAVGDEMTGKGAGEKIPNPTASKIYLDGREVSFTAYNIGGSNYFKLRDIGQTFNFGVAWDGAKNMILIDTSKGYTPE